MLIKKKNIIVLFAVFFMLALFTVISVAHDPNTLPCHLRSTIIPSEWSKWNCTCIGEGEDSSCFGSFFFIWTHDCFGKCPEPEWMYSCVNFISDKKVWRMQSVHFYCMEPWEECVWCGNGWEIWPSTLLPLVHCDDLFGGCTGACPTDISITRVNQCWCMHYNYPWE